MCLNIVNYGFGHDPCFKDFLEFRIFVLDKLNDNNITIAIDKYLASENKNTEYIPAIAYSQEHESKHQRIMMEHEVAEIGSFVKYELNGDIKFIELKEGSDQKLLVSNLTGKRKDCIVELKRILSFNICTKEYSYNT